MMRVVSVSMVNLLAIVALIFKLQSTQAEEPTAESEGQIPVRQSEDILTVQPYEKYDLIGKMRLSAAYFVNPTLADNTELGYFVPLANLDDEERVAAEGLIQEGTANVSVMTSDGKFYKVIDPKINLEFDSPDENVGIILDSRWRAEGVPVVSWGSVTSARQDEVWGGASLQDAPK